jgi:hypothetical protein
MAEKGVNFGRGGREAEMCKGEASLALAEGFNLYIWGGCTFWGKGAMCCAPTKADATMINPLPQGGI